VAQQAIAVLESAARAGLARNSLPAPFTNTVRAPRVIFSRSIAPAIPESLLESELFGHEKGAVYRGRD